MQHTPDKVALIWEKDEPGTEEKITYRYDMFLLLGFKIISAEFGKVIQYCLLLYEICDNTILKKDVTENIYFIRIVLAD